MGGFVSKVDRSAKERSDAIDRQLKEDGKQLKKEHKILLLGEYFKCPLYTYLFGLSKPFPLSSTVFLAPELDLSSIGGAYSVRMGMVIRHFVLGNDSLVICSFAAVTLE